MLSNDGYQTPGFPVVLRGGPNALSFIGLMYQYEDVDVYDPILSLANPSEHSELSDDSEQEKVTDIRHLAK